ncbi:hypothetical protein Cni_G02484 [Canna indica]|uniref:Uncharacterized protein n=1 Tax=Canna indica TaxID=4628 RepID=A0AAQ3JPI0_9LILI|nr:hypothetical protein Cni_G02484 [Canna indica]
MVGEEMNILTMIFLMFDNQKIYYPNSVLATLPINNFYGSPNMGDAIDFCVDVSTPVQKIVVPFDNQKIYYPNRVLATLPINNFYRSPYNGDSIDFCVDVSTLVEKLVVMK